MGYVLLASLGETPGVVTATVDELLAMDPPLAIKKIVLLWLNKRRSNVPREVAELKHEFGPAGRYTCSIELDCSSGSLDFADMFEPGANEEFLAKSLQLIDEYGPHHVIVSISGGRKTMSALLYAAALNRGVRHICQVLTAEKVPVPSLRTYPIDQIAHPERWEARAREVGNRKLAASFREAALHPGHEVLRTVWLPGLDAVSGACQVRTQQAGRNPADWRGVTE